MNREWEDAHKVTEELVEGPPSRRANATLTPCPSGNYLWCIGGEFFSDDGKAYFYNDVYRYNPDKDEWRKFVSPTCPGPRDAHAVLRQLEEENSSCSAASLAHCIRTHSITTRTFGALISALIRGIAWILRSDPVRGQDIEWQCGSTST
ncbi:hypothetical protein C8R48DRAFT_202613 [Suillus tomentosus]|nr:hypothetical protein C8R48DRAFT_202613 [Suillus tomentosus]